ncbi:MAG: asparagine synthase (glutamine-hydrolyzing) [Calditrichia bacterium]
MCGITGYFSFERHPENIESLIRKMTDQLEHRGPDAAGIFTDDRIALGHRRLSIIDLSESATQPMSNADGTLQIVFNGEIYNFPEIRQRFVKEGYPFKTRSDTEVLLALYEKYGVEMLPHINGMFAFAIWDAPKKRLFAARDRMGKKPFYYFRDHRRFIFGSELKSILADSSVPRNVSPESVEMYFSFIFIPGSYTIFKDIHKLPPGHFLLVTPDQFKVEKYWDINFDPVSPDSDKSRYFDELDHLLQAAVKRRMISDVPLGAFLSGGIDSSAVVGMMSEQDEQPVKTFTIGYQESDYSETADARFVAEHFRTEHREMVLRPSAVEALQKLVWHFDEPFGDASGISTFYVSRFARQHVTVALSGDGGDELFAGYTRYLRRNDRLTSEHFPIWLRRLLRPAVDRLFPINLPGRNTLLSLLNPSDSRQELGIFPYVKNRLFSGDFRLTLGDFEINLSLFPHLQPVDHLHPQLRHQYLDIKLYLPDDILVKVDRTSMAVSLEARAPLLDYTVAEFAAKLPPEWQLENRVGKAFLKTVLRRHLPEEVFNKPKHGFDIPKKHWFRRELYQYAREIVLSPRAVQRGYFDLKMVDRIFRDHAAGKDDYSVWLWTMLVFELWNQTFIDADTRRI